MSFSKNQLLTAQSYTRLPNHIAPTLAYQCRGCTTFVFAKLVAGRERRNVQNKKRSQSTPLIWFQKHMDFHTRIFLKVGKVLLLPIFQKMMSMLVNLPTLARTALCISKQLFGHAKLSACFLSLFFLTYLLSLFLFFQSCFHKPPVIQ